jgi:predicted ATPase/DNA-binding CsgD family transcriptional regulator
MRARRYHNELVSMLNATDRSAIIAAPAGLNGSPMSPERPAAKPNPIRLRAVPTERIEPHLVAPARSGNLPRPLTSLIGRDAEIASVLALLADDDVCLLTLTGPGGVGKTRLAISVAASSAATFADGVVFVALAPITDPELILPAIAHALGLREIGAHPLLEQITAYLGPRELLLILDNFEHLLPAATVVADLLAACPRLTVLVTSRSVLRLSGEHDFPVPPLPLPDAAGTKAQLFDSKTVSPGIECAEAVQLFVARARAARPDFTLAGANADAVAEICRRLDGLPLAIELAAARLRVLTPVALQARLEHRLDVLVGGPQDVPDRLRTIRNAIAWSYELLSPGEQTLFRRLAVFGGGFTLEAAEAVGGMKGEEGGHGVPPPVLDVLAALIDQSLVQPAPANGNEMRYLMLETVREFARERLAESGEAATIENLHAAYMADFAERAEPVLLGREELQWLGRCDAELGNLRAALAWSLEHEPEIALRIGAALWFYWAWQLVAEGQRWLSAALDRSAGASALIRARALTTLGALAVLQGDVTTCVASARLAIELALEAGDPMAEALARWVAACPLFYTDAVAPAVPQLDRALPQLAQATTSMLRSVAAYARAHRAAAAFMLGDVAQGLTIYEEAITRAREVGSGEIKLLALSDFAGWLIELGETARARALLLEALALAADYHQRWLMAVPLLSLALVDAMEGGAATAARRLGADEAIWPLTGFAVPTHIQDRIDRATALARAALGDETFAAHWEAGWADPEAVIAAVLGHAGAATMSKEDVAPSRTTDALTPREQEILRLLVAGWPDKEIASSLGIGRRTVSNHVATLRGKLDAPSRSAAAAIAMRDHLV